MTAYVLFVIALKTPIPRPLLFLPVSFTALINLTVEGFIPSRLNSAFIRFSERLNTLKIPNIIREKSNCNFITENMTYFNQMS